MSASCRRIYWEDRLVLIGTHEGSLPPLTRRRGKMDGAERGVYHASKLLLVSLTGLVTLVAASHCVLCVCLEERGGLGACSVGSAQGLRRGGLVCVSQRKTPERSERVSEYARGWARGGNDSNQERAGA